MTAEEEFQGFLAEFEPEIVDLVDDLLAKLRTVIPPAVELVYDNYQSLVVGFSPTGKPAAAPLSLVVFPRRVNLCFIYGATLPDPKNKLEGDGKQVRHVVLREVADLDEPALKELVAVAVDAADGWDLEGERQMTVRAQMPNKRPRRPAAAS